MSDSQVRIEGLPDVEALLNTLPANARFGASIGLNRTADEVQDAIRNGLSSRFTLRRKSFIERTIYRKPGEDFATKDQPEMFARVRIQDDRDFLAKFEEGGQKKPIHGRALAVPVEARPTKSAIVPQRYTLKALFFNRQSLLSQAKTVGATTQKGRRKMLLKRSVASDVAVIDNKVFQRVGAGRSFKLKLLWVFKPVTWLPRSLHFEQTARDIAGRRLRANVEGAIEVEISRGLTFRSGAK